MVVRNGSPSNLTQDPSLRDLLKSLPCREFSSYSQTCPPSLVFLVPPCSCHPASHRIRLVHTSPLLGWKLLRARPRPHSPPCPALENPLRWPGGKHHFPRTPAGVRQPRGSRGGGGAVCLFVSVWPCVSALGAGVAVPQGRCSVPAV